MRARSIDFSLVPFFMIIYAPAIIICDVMYADRARAENRSFEYNIFIIDDSASALYRGRWQNQLTSVYYIVVVVFRDRYLPRARARRIVTCLSVCLQRIIISARVVYLLVCGPHSMVVIMPGGGGLYCTFYYFRANSQIYSPVMHYNIFTIFAIVWRSGEILCHRSYAYDIV